MPPKQDSSKKTKYFIIPHTTMKEMDELIHNTHDTGKEHGMSLCVEHNSNRVISGYKSKGTEIGISVPETCRGKNQKYIGSFHTHPDDSVAASSAMDIHSSCLKMSNLDCIGKNEIGEIVCLEKKEKNTSCIKDAEPLVKVEDAFHEIPYGQLVGIKKELYGEVDKLASKKFIIHKIK